MAFEKKSQRIQKSVSCIILNKSFIGSYLEDDGHNAHEVINFLKADDGENYIYCNPYGQNVKGSENYDIKYFLVTTSEHKGVFYIEYVFEVKKVLHTQTMPRNTEREVREKNAKEAEKQICENLSIKSLDEITYKGESVRKIAEDNGDVVTIPVTFQAGKIFKAKKIVKVKQIKTSDEAWDYNFQRNFGYVTEDKCQETYRYILDIINDKENWTLVDFSNSNLSDDKEIRPTFMDLIEMHRDEECYTRILGNIFGCNRLLNVPCVKAFISELFKHNKISGFKEIDFSDIQGFMEFSLPKDECNKKSREKSGRIDLLFKSRNFSLVIENKVDSGINYIKDGNKKLNQMGRYFNFFHDENGIRKDFYFILAPTNKILSLSEEIEKLDDKNKDNYIIIDYSFIYDFVSRNKNLIVTENFKFEKYYDDILEILRYLTFDNKKICELRLLKNKNSINSAQDL